jgi:hypothetical protein
MTQDINFMMTKTTKLIDNLKVVASYGLGNDGNNLKLLQVFFIQVLK